MSIERNIRKLARSSYWQNIYRSSKENHGIQLFENNTNFSGLQHIFIYWLKRYSIVYDKLINREYDILNDDVIDNDTRLDAFFYYMELDYKKKINENKTQENLAKANSGKRNHNKYTPYRIYKGATKDGE